jgi:hypothetical protein
LLFETARTPEAAGAPARQQSEANVPLQNRVTPFGELVAVPARGTFTGNRGIIHDPASKTLVRRWSSKAWLVCLLDFEDRHREVWAKRSWSELFFLDEATALAAGHRPCFHCRRAAANAFRAAWAGGGPLPSALEMDATLHAQRLDRGEKRLHPLLDRAGNLPDGSMVAAGKRAFIVVGGKFAEWTVEGYRPVAELPPLDGMLTPPATVAALRRGYRPVIHPRLPATFGG